MASMCDRAGTLFCTRASAQRSHSYSLDHAVPFKHARLVQLECELSLLNGNGHELLPHGLREALLIIRGDVHGGHNTCHRDTQRAARRVTEVISGCVRVTSFSADAKEKAWSVGPMLQPGSMVSQSTDCCPGALEDACC